MAIDGWKPRAVEVTGPTDPAVSALPAIQYQLEQALERLDLAADPECCEHGPGPLLFACARHPDDRLRCAHCAAVHASWEACRCDQCGRVPGNGWLRPLAQAVPVSFYAVEGGPARRSLVIVSGLAVCASCECSAVA